MKDEANRTNIKLLLQALLVGICTGVVVGLFRFGIEKTSGFWLYLFQLAHQNPLWFIAIIIGFIAVAVIAGYFVKQYPHVGGSGIPEVKLQLREAITTMVSNFMAEINRWYLGYRHRAIPRTR